MRRAEVQKILGKKFIAYRDDAVAAIKELPPECLLSGDDSGLEDAWEEFKVQVQGEESVLFEFYVELIERLCRDRVEKLPDHERELLWLDSEGHFEADDGDPPPRGDELTEGVTQELYRRVVNLAANEDLKYDPDQERRFDGFQDDLT